MHYYGDPDFNQWDELDQAAEMIGLFCRRWGRIMVTQYKEKYGTVRVYCSFGCPDLHHLIFPGYTWVKWPYKFWTFPVFKPLQRFLIPYQQWIYRLAYQRAIKKFPALKKEILYCADWEEYLGGL